MSADFFDKNVLLYLISSDVEKADRVEALVRRGGRVSVQVLNEATNVMRRKLRMNWPEIHEFLGLLRALFEVSPVTLETHEIGLHLAERYGLSTYDALIAAAAKLDGCDRLWSQDMQDGQLIGNGLRIENPFR